jgi:hypothetical protein
VSEQSGNGPGNSGRGYDPGPTERMSTFNPVFKIRYVIHKFGNLKIGREVTVGQLFGAIFGFLFVWLAMRMFVTTGWPSLAAGLGAATLVVRGLALAEDAGRPPYVELYRFLNFALFAPRYYRGARPLGGMQKRRLAEMFAREQALDEHAGASTASEVLKEGLADIGSAVLRTRRTR